MKNVTQTHVIETSYQLKMTWAMIICQIDQWIIYNNPIWPSEKSSISSTITRTRWRSTQLRAMQSNYYGTDIVFWTWRIHNLIQKLTIEETCKEIDYDLKVLSSPENCYPSECNRNGRLKAPLRSAMSSMSPATSAADLLELENTLLIAATAASLDSTSHSPSLI